jgi:hypothetical protein
MIESRAGQLLPISAPKDSQSAIVAERQQKRILDKVWDTVEKAMGEMRTLLVNQLREPGRAIEDQEKTIERVALSFVLFDRVKLSMVQDSFGAQYARRSRVDIL